MKIYSVCEMGFETDEDNENHHLPTGDVLRIVESYRSEAAATAKREVLNMQDCSDATFNPWDYGDCDPFDGVSIETIQAHEGCEDVDDIATLEGIWDTLNDDVRQQLWLLSGCDHEVFYSVKSNELVDCQIREPQEAS
jgi:hypothetical protein